MTSRREINNQIVEWIANRAKTEYADDISLVFIYGSHVNGTDNHKSDVDCYYIPKTERGYHMAVDFMIDGVGYDIFPMSWDRVAGIADLREGLQPLVGDVQIIYSCTPGDLERFSALQEKLKQNLLSDEMVREAAVRKCEEANRMCTRMNRSEKASEIRKLAGSILITLADAVAFYHHDYYHFGTKKQFENLKNNFSDIPQSIVESYQRTVEAIDPAEVKAHAMKMFKSVCEYLGITCSPLELPEEKRSSGKNIDAAGLAGLYEEISSTFNKIYVCCESGNYILAFLSAACLQWELDEAREAGCPEYDLLSDFNYTQLSDLYAVTQNIENDFVQFITANGGHIKRYDSFEEFEKANL